MPVIDGPEAHIKVEKILFRLRETAAEINRATNDKRTREAIKRSWKMQDMLLFQDPVRKTVIGSEVPMSRLTSLDYYPFYASIFRTPDSLWRPPCRIPNQENSTRRVHVVCTVQTSITSRKRKQNRRKKDVPSGGEYLFDRCQDRKSR